MVCSGRHGGVSQRRRTGDGGSISSFWRKYVDWHGSGNTERPILLRYQSSAERTMQPSESSTRVAMLCLPVASWDGERNDRPNSLSAFLDRYSSRLHGPLKFQDEPVSGLEKRDQPGIAGKDCRRDGETPHALCAKGEKERLPFHVHT